ncbi:MAG: methylmalonyl-CoA mutase family protein [Fidelibacterota bacterium]|nr:MAG: methylmalonyl-CoA mutase family protein [Candidatus Neomarinimicrobiota bacterium]
MSSPRSGRISAAARTARRQWEDEAKSAGVRDYSFNTVSGQPVDMLYLPPESDDNYLEKWGFPGQYPFTRGAYPNMYRGRFWTMRQFAGFGTPEETNERYKFLLRHGQTGLSVAYDMPTLMGYDADDNCSLGEVGRCGVNVSSLEDMETLFTDIDLGAISVSQTINGPAFILLAFYVATAENQGVPRCDLTGTLQADILKEYIAQKEWIFPPRESMRIVTDMVEFCTDEMPRYNSISVSGYHIREAGSTAVQELAFTLADGFAYIEHGIDRGMDVDAFAPRISFFFNSHLDFFEEIAKFRAARRIWARWMKNRYGARDPRSWRLRFHTQTAGCTLTEQQPENNISRTAFQALAAVLGGTNSLHTNAMDETIALPTEKAAMIALRTQQLIAYETGVANVIDPLAGSWFVESMTDAMEEQAEAYFQKIDELGGVIPAIEAGFFQREIARAAYDYQRIVETGQRIVVGVNEFVNEAETLDIPILKISAEVEQQQRKKLESLRTRRNSVAVEAALKRVSEVCHSSENILYPVIEAAKAYATLGEIVAVMKEELGIWVESTTF